jgi:hypothetical protein
VVPEVGDGQRERQQLQRAGGQQRLEHGVWVGVAAAGVEGPKEHGYQQRGADRRVDPLRGLQRATGRAGHAHRH